jgi:hypothetical protein
MTYDLSQDKDFCAIMQGVELSDGLLKDAWVVYKDEKWYPVIIKDRQSGISGFEVNFSGRWGKNKAVGRKKLILEDFLVKFADSSYPSSSTIRCKRIDDNQRNARDVSNLRLSSRLKELLVRLSANKSGVFASASTLGSQINESDERKVVLNEPSGKQRLISEADLLDILNRQRENGAVGERIVLDWEKKRLANCGCSTPDDFVTHTSKENVAAGFDIHSNWTVDQERFIEVKTTASGAEYFFMSENEKQVLANKAGKAYIYIVDLDSSDKEVGTVRMPIQYAEAAFEFEPVAYRVRIKR